MSSSTVPPSGPRRRLFVPEVVQTSAMDCGPAALKALLEGFRIPVSYGRLREACQTDVDGSSIDSLEDVANQLGLLAEQVMMPLDHVMLPEAEAVPSIAVVRPSGNDIHFVVLWRTHGRFVQVMDPATGRRWPSVGRFLNELYVHTMPVSAREWRDWAGSPGFTKPLGRRLAQVGGSPDIREDMLGRAEADPGWKSLARLDAATRMVRALIQSGGMNRGGEAIRVLDQFVNAAGSDEAGGLRIPSPYWTVQPFPDRSQDSDRLVMKAALLVTVHGVRNPEAGARERPRDESSPEVLSPDLASALKETPFRSAAALGQALRADGLLRPLALIAAIFLAAGAVLLETILFRGLIDLSGYLGLATHRLMLITAVAVFLLALLLLELPIVTGLKRLGRSLEARMRIAFLEKVPRLGDRYFRSRPASDMADRMHLAHSLRDLPMLGGGLLGTCFTLLFTVVGISVLDPPSALLAVVVAFLATVIPLATQGLFAERDLRVKNHHGGLSLFYLDALRGLIPIRVHGAQRAVRREHEYLLTQWGRASLGLQRAFVLAEGVQQLSGFALSAWLVANHAARGGEPGGTLLLIYWALNLPFLGEEIAVAARQYPSLRNLVLRLLEPLGAPDEGDVAAGMPKEPAPETASRGGGVAIGIQNVSVRLAGHIVLEDITLDVPGGSEVAIVGRSGAGKSSLVGLLLGWHRPSQGCLIVDGASLRGERLAALRRETAWVDPGVQIWNRSLLKNLQYGNPVSSSIGQVIERADLGPILESMSEGLQTALGEGGGLVSGGEGQRVRLGRAMMRPDVRLVILDEPFRGLDRSQRRSLLRRARDLWRGATLICITHDVKETVDFERVVVMESGRIAEDGCPDELKARDGSRYRELLDAESEMGEVWQGDSWRSLTLKAGRLEEGEAGNE